MRSLERVAVVALMVAAVFGFCLAVVGGFVEALVGLSVVWVSVAWTCALVDNG